jgi:hypothetical protein
LDIEPLWLARVVDYIAASDKLTAADFISRESGNWSTPFANEGFESRLPS